MLHQLNYGACSWNVFIVGAQQKCMQPLSSRAECITWERYVKVSRKEKLEPVRYNSQKFVAHITFELIIQISFKCPLKEHFTGYIDSSFNSPFMPCMGPNSGYDIVQRAPLIGPQLELLHHAKESGETVPSLVWYADSVQPTYTTSQHSDGKIHTF